MKSNFSLLPHTVYIWHAWLPSFHEQLDEFLHLLNSDEMARATRFHFPIHRERYILARALLRNLLSAYVNIPADKIVFNYNEHGKPSLQLNEFDLQFNVSHSHDIALYAFTKTNPIGVDIEKMDKPYNEGLAQRFFSEQEFKDLCELPEPARREAFYQIWAGKEALIKACGEGLSIGLNKFSLRNEPKQLIEFSDQNFHVENFAVHAEYKSAVAVQFCHSRESGNPSLIIQNVRDGFPLLRE